MGPESVVSSVASVPPGAFVWPVVPVQFARPESCFAVCGVWTTRRLLRPFSAACGRWPKRCFATASAAWNRWKEVWQRRPRRREHPSKNKPATSTQTPAAKRKCDRTIILSPPGTELSACNIVAVPWVPRESVGQTRHRTFDKCGGELREHGGSSQDTRRSSTGRRRIDLKSGRWLQPGATVRGSGVAHKPGTCR